MAAVADEQIEQALREAVARAEPELDGLAAEVAGLLHREMDEFSDDADSREDTRRACLSSFRILSEALRSGREEPRLNAPPEQLAAARALARKGRSVRPVMRMFNLAHAATFDLWDRHLSASELDPEIRAEAQRRAHQFVFGWIDHLTEQLNDEFERERERWSRSPDAIRAETVRAIIGGEELDSAAASRSLGYDLERSHLAAILWAPSARRKDDAARAVHEIAAELAAGPGKPLVLPAGGSRFWAWVAARRAPADLGTLAARCEASGVRLALGEPAHGLAGFAESHRDAAAAANVAMLSGHRTVTRHRDVELAALLIGNLERARRFVAEQLGPLADHGEEPTRLRETLRVYLEENASRTAAGARLDVHPNTVANRIRACQELLGRELSDRPTELRVALELAGSIGWEG